MHSVAILQASSANVLDCKQPEAWRSVHEWDTAGLQQGVRARAQFFF